MAQYLVLQDFVGGANLYTAGSVLDSANMNLTRLVAAGLLVVPYVPSTHDPILVRYLAQRRIVGPEAAGNLAAYLLVAGVAGLPPFAAYAFGAPNFALVAQNTWYAGNGTGNFLVTHASAAWAIANTTGRMTYQGPAGVAWMICHQLAIIPGVATGQGMVTLAKNGALAGTDDDSYDLAFREGWEASRDNLMTLIFPVTPAVGDYYDLLLQAPGGAVPQTITGDTWTIRAWAA